MSQLDRWFSSHELRFVGHWFASSIDHWAAAGELGERGGTCGIAWWKIAALNATGRKLESDGQCNKLE